MLSRASVDQRLTGTDSSMKLSRRSVSAPFWAVVDRAGGGGGEWAGGTAADGRGFDPRSTRCRKSPTGLSGRVTAKEDINLPFIVSPIAAPRNDFCARSALDSPVGSSTGARAMGACTGGGRCRRPVGPALRLSACRWLVLSLSLSPSWRQPLHQES